MFPLPRVARQVEVLARAGCTRSQSGSTPAAYRVPRASSICWRWGWSLRSEATRTTSAPRSASTSSIAVASTGCGPTSTTAPGASANSRPAAAAKRTGCRTFRHQYSASSSPPSTRSPVTVDTSGIPAGRGRMARRAASSGSRISSIWWLW
ncbi:hypothetical protein NKH77_44755 [Streptomyces sp. M19]